MTDYSVFNNNAVECAILSAKKHYESYQTNDTVQNSIAIDDGHISILAECIEVTVKDKKVCLELPLKLGKICIPIPINYNGKVAKACMSICTTWGIPSGVEVTISVGGVRIVKKHFGKC